VSRRSEEYNSWINLKQRCDNPNNPDYKRSGGRGITYCERWKTFELFLEDVGERSYGLTLDRKDNNGNYCKANCAWSSPQQQGYNQNVSSNNTTGLRGVSLLKRNETWIAYYYSNNHQFAMYKGKDFFEACCARKSWEYRYLRPFLREATV